LETAIESRTKNVPVWLDFLTLVCIYILIQAQEPYTIRPTHIVLVRSCINNQLRLPNEFDLYIPWSYFDHFVQSSYEC